MMGTEQEVGLQVMKNGVLDEPYHLAEQLYDYLPEGIEHSNSFLSNGMRLYVGGSNQTQKPTNIEIATPECVNPHQQLLYIRASQLLIEEILKKYVESNEDVEYAAIHHRVVDVQGNRKGCHDNVSLPSVHLGFLGDLMANFVAARSLVAGSGYFAGNGLRFSQKVGGLAKYCEYGYLGSVYRVDNTTGPRLEVRCGDVNISDWATLHRVGMTALFATMLNVPECVEELSKISGQRSENGHLTFIKRANVLSKDIRETVQPSNCAMQSLGYLQRFAEICVDILPNYVNDVPSSYFWIGRELLRFSEDLELVLNDKKDVAVLADRADWAMKAVLMKDNVKDATRYQDYKHKGRVTDLGYDYVMINKDNGTTRVGPVGKGIRLRQKGLFREAVQSKDIVPRMRGAPKETRASARAQLIKDGLKVTDWDDV